MAEFKKLSDVEVVAEPAESANVLIEEDGVIKKAPKTAVGGAGGDIQADFSQNDSSAPDYVKNRTHYSEINSFSKDNVQTESMTISGTWTGESYDYIAADLGTVAETIGDTLGNINFVSIIYDGQEYQRSDLIDIDIVKSDLYGFKLYDSDFSPDILEGYKDGDYHIFLVTPEAGSHSIEIVLGETVHKLDAKYLPDSFDMVIRCEGSNPTIESGSYEAIREKLKNGEMVEVALLTIIHATDNGYCAQRSTSVEMFTYSHNINITFTNITQSNTLQIKNIVVNSRNEVTMTTHEISLG